MQQLPCGGKRPCRRQQPAGPNGRCRSRFAGRPRRAGTALYLPSNRAFRFAADGTPTCGFFEGDHTDPAHFDLGLRNPPAGDLARRTDLCGAFKVPSLCNVALRKACFHNGRFGTLKEALTFYMQRDTQPGKGYPLRADGTVDMFNDLPPAGRGNGNRGEAPYNRQRADAPALSDAEINELIAFRANLSHGFTP